MTDRELMSRAKAASMNAYVPYSRFSVGAALECDDGTVFTGCNVENAALGSTICAERTACCKAVSEGHRSFRRIAIYADSENWCTPCGACRQFLAELRCARRAAFPPPRGGCTRATPPSRAPSRRWSGSWA